MAGRRGGGAKRYCAARWRAQGKGRRSHADATLFSPASEPRLSLPLAPPRSPRPPSVHSAASARHSAPSPRSSGPTCSRRPFAIPSTATAQHPYYARLISVAAWYTTCCGDFFFSIFFFVSFESYVRRRLGRCSSTQRLTSPVQFCMLINNSLFG